MFCKLDVLPFPKSHWKFNVEKSSPLLGILVFVNISVNIEQVSVFELEKLAIGLGYIFIKCESVSLQLFELIAVSNIL